MTHEDFRLAPAPTASSLRAAMILIACFFCFVHAGCSDKPSLEDVREQQQNGLFTESITPLRLLLREEGASDDPEILYLYGRALSMDGQPTAALWALRKAMREPEYRTRAALEIASGGLRTMNYSLAIEGATEAIESDPESQTGYEIRSMGLIQTRQDYEAALADADRALEIDPESGRGLVARGIALLGLERIEEAGEAIEIAGEHFATVNLGLGRDAGKYCAVRGKFAFEKGEPERAEEIYLECLESYPAHDLLVRETVSLLDDTGKIAQSNEILRKALEERPRNRSIRVALARRFEVIGETEEAEALLQEASEFDQPTLAAQALWDLAGFQMSQGRADEGLASFEKAVALRGARDPEMLFAYGDALASAGRYDEALALAEGMDSEPHREMVKGRVYFEREDHARALEHFAAGLQLWPNNSVVRYLAALCAEELGDYQRAIDEYRYAMREGASATESRFRLARLFFAEGNYAQALAVLRHDFQKTPPDFEEALLELEVMDRLGQTQGSIPGHLSDFSSSVEFRTRAWLIFIEGAWHRAGPRAAARLIQSSTSLDFSRPENLPIFRRLIESLIESEQGEEARAVLARAMEASPELAGLHGLQGLLLDRGGQTGAAAASFQRALELDPDEMLALETQAEGHGSAAEIEEALAIYERLSVLQPREEAWLLAAAELLEKHSQPDRAEQYLRRAIERNPYNGEAALRLARAEKKKGRGEKSLALARRAARFGGGPEAKAFLLESWSGGAGQESPGD